MRCNAKMGNEQNYSLLLNASSGMQTLDLSRSAIPWRRQYSMRFFFARIIITWVILWCQLLFKCKKKPIDSSYSSGTETLCAMNDVIVKLYNCKLLAINWAFGIDFAVGSKLSLAYCLPSWRTFVINIFCFYTKPIVIPLLLILIWSWWCVQQHQQR